MNMAERLSLEYIYAGIIAYQAGDKLAERRLTDYEFVAIRRGSPTYRCNGASFELKPGSVVLGRPGSLESYEWDSAGPTQHSFFHFSIARLPDDILASEGALKSAIIDPPPVIPLLVNTLVDELVEEKNQSDQTCDRGIACKVEALLRIYLEAQEDKSTFARFTLPVGRALGLMRKTLETRAPGALSLGDLSAASHVSEKHLCRLFANEVGISPLQTYRLMQMQFSLVLLARTNTSIKDLARQLGFDDALYFSRFFSKTYGLSPSRMRQRLLTGERPPASKLPAGIAPISLVT